MKRQLQICAVLFLGVFCIAGSADAADTVDVVLNGESTEVAIGTTVAELVQRLSDGLREVDVTVNGREIDRGDFDDVTLEGGDEVEIVEAVKGRRYGFGLGVGLVNLNEEALQDDVETYFNAHFRIPIGDPDARGRGSRRRLQGYLEPELGYWDGDTSSDVLLGVNIIGSVPLDALDFFVGAGIGVHFLDSDPEFRITGESDSEEAVGVNAQFGIDVHMSESFSLFGVGRFDIVDEGSDSLEAKAYVGLRWRF